MFPAFAVAVLTLVVLPALALPIAVGGLTVAAFHVAIGLGRKLECPAGVMSAGTAPQQSLAVLTVPKALLVHAAVRASRTGETRFATVAGALLGVLLGVASLLSSPPMPPAPPKAYEAPLDACRPPFLPR